MNCRRCRAENPDTSRYCANCGALLTRSLAKPKRRVPWYLLVGLGALIAVAAGYLFLPGLRPSSHRAGASVTSASEPAAPGAASPGATSLSPNASSFSIAAGRFSLEGAPRGASSSIETALFDGAWAALPLWTFMGAGAPRLESPGPSGARPGWVDWNASDPIVLLRLDLDESLRTPELAPYDEGAALEWRPLSGERTSLSIETGPLRSAGSFKTFGLFREIEAPGVLVQGDRLVGWTFGMGIARGYLWAPSDGAGPKPLLSTADLAASVRAGSREAAFTQALAMANDISDDHRLAALAAGFRSRAALSADDLPPHLKPSAVASRMASLALALIERGSAADVAMTLDPAILAAASDIALIKAAARAYNDARGFDAAHRLLVDLRRDPAIQTAPAFRELDAVEVVLEKKWGRAGDLLQAKQYPTALSDKARTLERLVEEGRRDEDSVTIRFNPGDKLIPVYAFLNKKVRQKFFIDTGATTTIIPPAAVSALEIRIDNTTPVVGFQGVAGSDLAYQVRIESIDIEGLTVFDIRAIVYDLGDPENTGLLGNDFLQHFQVDLDSIKGVLKLRKK
jgi:predicted aspartyl protease